MNTGVGVAFAVLLFGERLSAWIWLAVALVFAGVAIVNRTHDAGRHLDTSLIDSGKRQYRYLEYAIHYVDTKGGGRGVLSRRGVEQG